MTEGIANHGLVFEKNYAKTMNEVVTPFLRERCQVITFAGAGEKPIAAFRFDADSSVGTVTVLHGFTECAEKFSEIVFSLLQSGFSVLTLDQRGHGASWRDEKITDPSLTHVDSFEEYVEDLRLLCDQELVKMPKPWYIFAHSMGGAVALAFLEDHPGVFSKAALCAPMVAPQRGGVPLGLAKAVCVGAKGLLRERKRILISKPWDGPEEFETSCATSQARFDWFDDLRVRTERYHNNGPTYSWTMEAFNVTARLLKAGKPEKVEIPVMIYTAEDDNQVLPEAQEQMASRLPKGTRKTVAGAKHEIYRSPDEVLFPWWGEILTFFREI